MTHISEVDLTAPGTGKEPVEVGTALHHLNAGYSPRAVEAWPFIGAEYGSFSSQKDSDRIRTIFGHEKAIMH